MNKINWGIFQNGFDWEHFMHLILQYQYGDRILTTNRPGPDLCIDAITKDYKTVYQSKFHQRNSMDTVIKDSLLELKKIKSLKNTNNSIWETVNKWILFANIKINVNDDKKWNEKIVSKFKEIGIEASYLSEEQIEREIIKYPDLLKHFFEQTNRIFHTFQEEKARLEKISYYPKNLEVEFIGREEELNKTLDFINNEEKSFLLITGSKGIGKTRFLFEVAKNVPEKWTPIWGTRNIINKEFSINKLPLYQDFIIFLDETIDYSLFSELKSLSELNIFKNWKIIITEENKDSRIVKELKSKEFEKFVAPIIELKPLKKEEVEIILNSLFSINNLNPNRKIFFELNKFSSRIPFWIDIYFMQLTNNYSFEFLEEYCDEFINKFSYRIIEEIKYKEINSKKLNEILSWLALFGKIKINEKENNEIVEFIIKQTNLEKEDFYTILDIIENNGLLQRKGADDKTLSLEPDIFKNYILKKALIINKTGEFTKFGEKILKILSDTEIVIPEIETVLQNLSRVEFYSEHKINLLDKFIDYLIETTKNSNAYIQKNLITFSENFSFNRPLDAIKLYKTVLYNKGETYFSEAYNFEFSHSMAIKSIPWEVFSISKYAESYKMQKEIYDFFIELIEYEETNKIKLGEKNSEGVRALLGRTLFGEYWSYKYYPLIIEKLTSIFKKLSNEKELNSSEIITLKTLYSGILSCERFVMGPSYDFQFSYYKKFITPGTKEWLKRDEFFKEGKKYIEKNSSDNNIFTIILEIYSNSFSSVNRLILPNDNPKYPEHIEYINNYFENEFNWIIDLLKNKNLTKQQKQFLRETWNWHYSFTTNEKLKTLATQCEELYFNSKDLNYISGLFNFGDKKDKGKSDKYFTDKFLLSKNIDEIFDLIKDVQLYKGNDSISFALINIIFNFAIQHKNENYVFSFIFKCIKAPEEDELYKIGCFCLTGLLKKYRDKKENNLAISILKKMKKETPNYTLLVSTIYEQAKFYNAGELTIEDFKFCTKELKTLKDFNKKASILAYFLLIFWDEVKKYIERNWIKFSTDEKNKFLSEFISQLNGIALFNQSLEQKVSQEKINWIMEKIFELDDIDILNSSYYEIENIIVENKYPLKWLVEKITLRIKKQEENPNLKVIPYFFNIESFVCTDLNKSENLDALFELLEIIYKECEKERYIEYLLMEFIVKIEPLGNILGKFVSEKIKTSEENLVAIYSYIGGFYPYDSEGWKIISKSACSKIEEFPDKKDEIFDSLIWHGAFNRSGSPYEISPYLLSEYEEAKIKLAKSEHFIKEFWEMIVKNIENEIEFQKQLIKERRGE